MLLPKDPLWKNVLTAICSFVFIFSLLKANSRLHLAKALAREGQRSSCFVCCVGKIRISKTNTHHCNPPFAICTGAYLHETCSSSFDVSRCMTMALLCAKAGFTLLLAYCEMTKTGNFGFDIDCWFEDFTPYLQTATVRLIEVCAFFKLDKLLPSKQP